MSVCTRIFFCLTMCVALPISARAQLPPRSVLFLEQENADTPWYFTLSSSFRATLKKASADPVNIYSDQLDLGRFNSPQYREVLRAYFKGKYQQTNIGAVIAIGRSTLDFVLDLRSELWPNASVVFVELDDRTLGRLKLPPNVTGIAGHMSLQEIVTAASTVMPNLKRIALAGDRLEDDPGYRDFRKELPVIAKNFEIVDLTGLPMSALKKQVANLTEQTAIIYTATRRDDDGVNYTPRDALATIAETANRPIFVNAESYLGYGAIGGFIFSPGRLGEDVAKLTLRILGGESASKIPITNEGLSKPIFDWRQLQRWKVSDSRLPPGSEIRFQEPTVWEEYRTLVVITLIVLLAQTAVITALVFEYRRRHSAEERARRSMSELASMDISIATNAISASIAHELNQPLGAILSNVEAAEALVHTSKPDMNLLKEILVDIHEADERAGEIIKQLRGLLKQGDLNATIADLDEAVRDVMHILEADAARRHIVLKFEREHSKLMVCANTVQIRQILINLLLNAMEAIDSASNARASPPRAMRSTFQFGSRAGHWPRFRYLIPALGRAIVESLHGAIWAENRTMGGSVFHFTLPLAQSSNVI